MNHLLMKTGKTFIEGKEATERFENAMKEIFRAPKPPKQEKPPKKAASGEKQK